MKMNVYIPFSIFSENQNINRYTDTSSVQFVRCEQVLTAYITLTLAFKWIWNEKEIDDWQIAPTICIRRCQLMNIFELAWLAQKTQFYFRPGYVNEIKIPAHLKNYISSWKNLITTA